MAGTKKKRNYEMGFTFVRRFHVQGGVVFAHLVLACRGGRGGAGTAATPVAGAEGEVPRLRHAKFTYRKNMQRSEHYRFPPGACDKVASDLGLGRDFSPPLSSTSYNWLVTTYPK